METNLAIAGQNRRMSLLESITGVIAGYVMTVLIQTLMYPLFGILIPTQDALLISLLIVSIAFFKNFAIRRFFNSLHVKGARSPGGET